MTHAFKENIYGHTKRLFWIIANSRKSDSIVELGCGTGAMITMPLTILGYNVKGVDFDEKSIMYGKSLFKGEGLNPEVISTKDIRQVDPVDVIIASEVLEHISDQDIDAVLLAIRDKLKAGGKLLITVPNGYGWFELESLLWFKLGVGSFLEKIKIVALIGKIKRILLGDDIECPFPSTLSNSLHVQRFTSKTICSLLESNGFKVTAFTGSVLFCGPFSNLFFTGVGFVMKINGLLGKMLPNISSGFYVLCTKK